MASYPEFQLRWLTLLFKHAAPANDHVSKKLIPSAVGNDTPPIVVYYPCGDLSAPTPAIFCLFGKPPVLVMPSPYVEHGRKMPEAIGKYLDLTQKLAGISLQHCRAEETGPFSGRFPDAAQFADDPRLTAV